MSLLIAAPDSADATALATRLGEAGVPVAGAVACHTLVREAVRCAPEAVVVLAPALDRSLQAQLRPLADAGHWPVLVLSHHAPPRDPALLIALRVWAWLPPDLTPDALGAAWAVLRVQAQAQREQAGALADARARLDERVWIDRAKGLLMRHQRLSEDDAFTLLRTASMHANLRVGEVSRGLIEAASAADAVNRAGQLRMLSQRMVKALALWLAGADRAQAQSLLLDSQQRLLDNLDRLGALGLSGAAAAQLAAAVQAGQALQAQALAAQQAVPQAWRAADDQAEALLVAADALTVTLELASGRQGLQVVNLCGRQRMLSQRLAKQALMATESVPGSAAAAGLQHTREDFEQALVALEQAPLANDEIRAALAQARAQWGRLLKGVQRLPADGSPAPAAALRAVALESEALLTTFDQLTSVYEHSLQLLLG